ncbi:MAG: three-Cys-motif partner protein TcmP [Sedimentisphaerales bacterium]|nr:three-Cys-motif partner protein TcmP [Sedimentisphaerales bacterium]
MASNSFFDEPTEQSVVKATIVEKYFDAWARVIIAAQEKYPQYTQQIGYTDLFAGRGCYENGADSTPVRILRRATANEEIRRRLVTWLNDKDPENVRLLREAINDIPGIETLYHKPEVTNEEVGEELRNKLNKAETFPPTLFFVDPYGYKGLTLSLIDRVVKDWGCDGIFFFNYNRINPGLSNQQVRDRGL